MLIRLKLWYAFQEVFSFVEICLGAGYSATTVVCFQSSVSLFYGLFFFLSSRCALVARRHKKGRKTNLISVSVYGLVSKFISALHEVRKLHTEIYNHCFSSNYLFKLAVFYRFYFSFFVCLCVVFDHKIIVAQTKCEINIHLVSTLLCYLSNSICIHCLLIIRSLCLPIYVYLIYLIAIISF